MRLGNRVWWGSLGLLVVLVGVLGTLQYRWIGEVSRSERDNLRQDLQSRLLDVSLDFNREINAALAALLPSDGDVHELGRAAALARNYGEWKSAASRPDLFERVAIAWIEDGEPSLWLLENGDPDGISTWPQEWTTVRARLATSSGGRPRGPIGADWRSGNTGLIELPRLSDAVSQEAPRIDDWLLAELDSRAAANAILPGLLARHLGADYDSKYEIEVTARGGERVFAAHGQNQWRGKADGSVSLFEVFPPRPRREAPQDLFAGDAPPPSPPGRGRWQLRVQLRSGSLDAIVARVRTRNLAVSGGILLLLLATCGALFQFSRRAQHLAKMEMQFVAGVSHELRTPLTVIRTAAFNLRGKRASTQDQVARYSALIEEESAKLTETVEHVLLFSGTKSGRALRDRTSVAAADIVTGALQSCQGILQEHRFEVQTTIDPRTPVIWADAVALTRALQNLIANAVKYAGGGKNWIGITARAARHRGRPVVEIEVCDCGPGVPPEERQYIFDPFFRGKNADKNQIHGTGLGLSLVKEIVEAHHGTVHCDNRPDGGAVFTLRVPQGEDKSNHGIEHLAG